jgi:hypothetical protein
MKYLRPALGVLLGLYVLRSLYFFSLTAGAKLGLMAAGQYGSLIDAIPIWQVVIWGAAIVAYVVAVVRFFRGGKALIPLVVAFVLDTGFYLLIKGVPAYAATVSPQDQQIDMISVGVLLVVIVLTWWTERSAPAAAAA